MPFYPGFVILIGYLKITYISLLNVDENEDIIKNMERVGFTIEASTEIIGEAEAEHGRTVHHYVITVRPVCGVGKGSGGARRDVVVGIGGN